MPLQTASGHVIGVSRRQTNVVQLRRNGTGTSTDEILYIIIRFGDHQLISSVLSSHYLLLTFFPCRQSSPSVLVWLRSVCVCEAKWFSRQGQNYCWGVEPRVRRRRELHRLPAKHRPLSHPYNKSLPLSCC